MTTDPIDGDGQCKTIHVRLSPLSAAVSHHCGVLFFQSSIAEISNELGHADIEFLRQSLEGPGTGCPSARDPGANGLATHRQAPREIRLANVALVYSFLNQ